MTTVQVHNNNYSNIDHNLRKGCHADMPHIDPKKSKNNEIWGKSLTVREAYEQIFGEAVKEYNAKQKRNDRKIKNYYQKIADDKQKNTEYEVVVGVYHPANKKGELYDLDGFTDEQAHDAIKEYFDTWPQRNPTLRLLGGYFHVDEIGQNHAHIPYVPAAKGEKEIKSGNAKGVKRGMSLENNLTNALAEMGFITGKSKGTAQQQWQRREAKVFEEICHKHGIKNIRHPRQEKKDRKNMDMTQYKQVMAVVNETAKDREAAAQERAAAQKIRQEAEREAAEQTIRLAQEREEADRKAAEQTARQAQEAAEHEANLRRIAADAQEAEAKKAKAEKEEKAVAERKKEAKDELELQEKIIDNQVKTILENEEILKKTDEKGIIAENKWLYSVIDAVEFVFPAITPILDKIFDLKGKKSPEDIAKAWDVEKQELVEEIDTAGKKKDEENER